MENWLSKTKTAQRPSTAVRLTWSDCVRGTNSFVLYFTIPKMLGQTKVNHFQFRVLGRTAKQKVLEF